MPKEEKTKRMLVCKVDGGTVAVFSDSFSRSEIRHIASCYDETEIHGQRRGQFGLQGKIGRQPALHIPVQVSQPFVPKGRVL